ncbi:MAG: hypothetical protein LUQ71_10345 [Methanoregula sp.]|nr:hypothetical protein [Methanoregula sp.]
MIHRDRGFFLHPDTPRHVTNLSMYHGTGITHLNPGDPDDVYDRSFEPPGGWIEWCSWALSKDVIARIVRTQAKNMMSFQFTHSDKDIAEKMNKMAARVHFGTDNRQGAIHWMGYGFAFFEPVWVLRGITIIGLERFKPIDAWTMKVFFDTPAEVAVLKAFLKRQGFAEQAYANTLQPGTGSKVIGFVQNWDRLYGTAQVFFRPDEIVYIARYPGRLAPEGMSLLRENYEPIMDKLGIRRSQARMAKRFCEPKPVYTVPKAWWDSPTLEKVKEDLKKLWDDGKSLFKPEGWEAEILELKGNPVGVIRAQEHIDDEFNTGMGHFDSVSDSTGANRSTSNTQFAFFERELQPDREIFAEALRPFIQKWISIELPEAGDELPQMVFEDLTPDDNIERANIVQPLIQKGLVHKAALVKFWEDMNYPAPSDEEAEEIIQAARSQSTASIGGGYQDPAAAAGGEDPKSAEPAAGGKDQRSQLSAAKGIPAGVKTTSSSAREKIKTEIEEMADDIASHLGL